MRRRKSITNIGSVTQKVTWFPLGYLAAVGLAGSLRQPPTKRRPPQHSFRVVIPAHNEAQLVGRSVASVVDAEYPSHLLDVIVVADNCSDTTADRARDAGARVWERQEPSSPGKGPALGWALDRLQDDEKWDAVVVLDADGIVAPDFFSVIDSRLQTGASVVQGERRVANAADSIVSRLAQISGAAQSVLRPRGRQRLGGAAKLFGTGMTIHRTALVQCPWRATGLTEDSAYWFDLLRNGIRPVHEPGAIFSDEMPATIASARVQRRRWEAGRFELFRGTFPTSVRRAVNLRDPVLAEALVSELLLPNLSTTAAFIAGAGFSRWLGSRRGGRVAFTQSAVLVAYLLLALRAARAPRATYAALVLAPAAGVWRVAVTVEAIIRGRWLTWQRTPREGDRG